MGRLMRASVLAAVALASPSALADVSIAQFPLAEHPAGDYERAAREFETGDKAEATCLFYRGQYRFRVHLAARPDLPPSGDPALMASLNDVLGRTINEWAGGDPDVWVDAMECALDWAQENDDPFTPKAEFASAHEATAEGLAGLVETVRSSKEEIRAERAARGLENR